MKINSLAMQNFYSFKKEVILFDNYKGITIIEGKNGAGKSSIFEAIIWVITGKSIRKSTEESMVNNKAKKGLKVAIKINDEIIIKRTRKPTSLQVWKGEENLSQDHANETQKIINELLNTNYKVLMASMVFGQHNNMDFLGASPDDKRVIIKNFLNLNEMFNVRDKIKSTKSELSTKSKNCAAVIYNLQSQAGPILLKLKSIPEEVKLPEESLEEVLEKENIVTQAHNEARILENQREGFKSDFERFSKILDKGEYSKINICGECDSEYTEIVDKNQVEEAKMNAEYSYKRFESMYPLIVEQRDLMIKNRSKITSYQWAQNKEIYDLAQQKEYLEESLKGINDEILDHGKIQKEADKKYEVMRFWEKAFSEAGVIRYLIRNVLKTLNNTTNKYLSMLTNGQYTIEFDEFLKEKIICGGEVVHFISLSSGEKNKINLSVMLGLQALISLSGKDGANLLFLDEIMSSVDEKSLHGVYLTLQDLKKGKDLFIITHNNDLKMLLESSNRLTIIKTDGISSVKATN